MTPLPPQTPAQPPRYRFRPRDDDYRAPVFPVRERREYVEPRETYDPRNEPRDLDWTELRDPQLIVAAVGTVLGGVALLVFWITA